MKNINYIFYCAILLFCSCNPGYYQNSSLSSHAAKENSLIPPPGMVFIPSGKILIGDNSLDSGKIDSSTMKQFAISAFFIDKTEVSNKEYKQFVQWVRDSVAVTDYLKDNSLFYPVSRYGDKTKHYINWHKVQQANIWNSYDRKVREKLRGMYVKNDDGFSSKSEIDINLLKYNYERENPDFKVVKGKKGSNKTVPRIIKEEVNIYPDTNVWESDFPNSSNTQMTKSYFSSVAYDDYPVVGVTWKQARAYASWKTMLWKRYIGIQHTNNYIENPIDLPTEAQWLYAASFINQKNPYVLAVDSIKKKDSIKMPRKKVVNKIIQDASFTLPVNYGKPLGIGLYHMDDNVSEWTINYYTLSSTAYVNYLNPVVQNDAKDSDPEEAKRKVVRGGSWKDLKKFVSTDARGFELQDKPRSFIGFRCVMAAPDFYSIKRLVVNNKSK